MVAAAEGTFVVAENRLEEPTATAYTDTSGEVEDSGLEVHFIHDFSFPDPSFHLHPAPGCMDGLRTVQYIFYQCASS